MQQEENHSHDTHRIHTDRHTYGQTEREWCGLKFFELNETHKHTHFTFSRPNNFFSYSLFIYIFSTTKDGI